MVSNFRIISWFSCGIPSAVASKLALHKYGGRVQLVRTDTGSEHPDNERFMRDVEEWLGVKVVIIKSDKYKNIDQVFNETRYLRGREGARCTVEMKKVPRYGFEHIDDQHIFGYTNDKRDLKRAKDFKKRNPELKLEYPLIENGYNRKHCERVIQEAGIEAPVMYKLGFSNNNCLGCVKSESPSYWMKVKRYFPGVFRRRLLQERELGFALCRISREPVFLDEIAKMKSSQIDLFQDDEINCDFLCGQQ